MTGTQIIVPEIRPHLAPMAFGYSVFLASDVADEMRTHATPIHNIRRASVLEFGRELIDSRPGGTP